MGRRGIELRTKFKNSFSGADVIKPQSLVQRINLGGRHVPAAGDDLGVPPFDLRREVEEGPHDELHFRHQGRGNRVVDDAKTTPLLTRMNQFVGL